MTAELEPLRADWTELALAGRNVFGTWEWATTWLRHRGRGHRPRATVVRSDDGRALAVLPLASSSLGPVRIVRFLGHGPADELGPVCAASDRDAAALALRQELTGIRSDLFLGEQLGGSEAWDAILGGRVVRHEASPTLRLAGTTWADVLGSRSANLRQQIGRRERGLAKAHAVRLRLADDPARLSLDLDALFALHGARWGSGSAFRDEPFHREFAAQALALGWLRLWLLELNGRPAAAWYGFRFAGVESYYQAGRDRTFDRWSVGFVLLVHTIREALADGMQEYRFLRGDEPFKYRFADANPGVATVAVPRSSLGRGLLLGGRVAQALPGMRPLLRRLVS